MKETRFIELLNLYVDQQLSPQEAAELEAEIQQNPARHRTYRQYCRMQKACAQLFEHERSAAPASTALARAMTDADRKIVAFPGRETRRAIWPVGFSIGAVAAAACVAFVVVWQNEPGAPVNGGISVAVVETTPVAKQETGVSAVAAVDGVKALPVMASDSADVFTSVFTVPSLREPANRTGGLFVSAAQTDNQMFSWTEDVQLKPLRKLAAEELAFDQRAAVDKPVTTPFLPTTAEDQTTEMTAFQFMK